MPGASARADYHRCPQVPSELARVLDRRVLEKAAMGVPLLDRAAVARLCDLAQLDVDEAGIDAATRALGSILAYAAELGEVDVEGVPPMDRPFADLEAELREDEPGEELDRERVLAEAPRSAEGGFDVPGFVDEG